MNKPTALITGSASGIGLEMAKLLAEKGYNLFLADIQLEALEKLRNEIIQHYPVAIHLYVSDLSELDAPQKIFNECMKKNIDIEILINNAGFFFFSEVAQADINKASKMILLHIHTSSLLAILFSQKMKEKKKGYILMTSSISVYKAFPGISFYAASKSFIKYFCRSLRYEMKYYGVHVTTLCPGATATNLYDPNVIDVEKGKRYGIMMEANQVAKAGITGLFKNKSVVIPGFITKIMTMLSIITPKWVIYWARVKWKKYF